MSDISQKKRTKGRTPARAEVIKPNTNTAKGGILRALRTSPLMGAGLDLNRLAVAERKVDLG